MLDSFKAKLSNNASIHCNLGQINNKTNFRLQSRLIIIFYNAQIFIGKCSDKLTVATQMFMNLIHNFAYS